MSNKKELASGAKNNPEFIAKVQERVTNSEHEEAVTQFLMKQYHVNSIDELLKRRGVYSAVAQIEILLDQLEKSA